jgi:hypothetical protein
MKRLIAIVAMAMAIACAPHAASAHRYHHVYYPHAYRMRRQAPEMPQAPQWGFGEQRAPESRGAETTYGSVLGGRPHGCPYQFCGCEASLFIFGHIVDALNLAANWLHFPHVEAAPGIAAVAPSRHHVLVLERHVSGPYWVVHDGNSGHHLTREHVRSIACGA